MFKHTLTLLALATLAACGGGGGGEDVVPATQTVSQRPAPAPAAPAPAPAPIVGGEAPGPAPEPAPVAAPIAATTPAPEPVPTNPPRNTTPPQPPETLCGPNLGGFMFPCDPRWPYNNRPPMHGSTQAQVDGFNAMCQTARCFLTRCEDARVYVAAAQAACMRPPTEGERNALNGFFR